MKKVLVTGGGGFLGQHIIHQLQHHNCHIRSLSRGHYPSLQKLGVETIQANLSDQNALTKACQGVDTVFHVAAKAGGSHDYSAYYQANVIGTNNVIRACQEQGVQKLIYTSSPSAILSTASLHNADESTPYPTRFYNPYQATKAQAEQAALQANSSQLMTCALRPHAIWGPGDQHLFPRILSRLEQGKLRIIGKGNNKISVSYVENCAHAHILAAQSDKVGGKSYFINEKEPVELWPWLNHLFTQLGIAKVQQRIPYPVAWGLGSLIDGFYRWKPLLGEPPISRYLCIQLGLDHYFSTQAAEQDFDYKPLVSMDRAIDKTLAALKTTV